MKNHFQKRSLLSRYYLKYTDRNGYRAYKKARLIHSQYQACEEFFREHLPALEKARESDVLVVKHGGHAGDLIYSLPAVRAVAAGRPIVFYLHLGLPGYAASDNHPAGGVRLNAKSFELMAPLLRRQPGFTHVGIYDQEPLHMDLDAVRLLPVTESHCIPRWYFTSFNAYADLAQPWLHAEPSSGFSGRVVVARSLRHRNTTISYDFLRQYDDLLFVGTPDEYRLMQAEVPEMAYHPVENFLEMAQIIQASRLFIGNQSLPYALAEALKVPRLLEVYPLLPNVIPQGGQAHDFYFQHHFEQLVRSRIA